jgi:hypothetical protein
MAAKVRDISLAIVYIIAGDDLIDFGKKSGIKPRQQ